jgi:membrane associated rhomboid family serine protease
MFVHDPRLWTHILFNMIALYFLGGFLIRAVGDRNFLVVFFLGGLVGNILFVLLADPFATGIGASGAIFALAGALAVMVPRLPVIIFPVPIPMPLWVATIILVLLSFVSYRVAWQAHIGGLLLGLIAGLILRRRRPIYSL